MLFECKITMSSKTVEKMVKKIVQGTSLVVQWLRLHTPSAGGVGSIPGWGTKMPRAAQRGQRK